MINSRRFAAAYFFVSVSSFFILKARPVSAETGTMLSSSTVSDVQVSTTPPSAAVTGETIGGPAPRAMTQPAGGGVFVTLTRAANSPTHLPVNASILTPTQGRSFDAQNVGDLVARAAGVSAVTVGQLGSPLMARIRGGTAADTLVLIDGRPMEGVSLGPSDLSEIPMEQVDHIEVVRGGMSALYGPNATGGVINVITKRSTYEGLPITHFEYEDRSYSAQQYRLDFGSRQGPVDYFFFGNQNWESGFRDNTDAKLYNVGGNVGYSLGKKGKLLLDVASYHVNMGVPGMDLNDLPPNRFNNKDEKIATSYTARQITDSNYIRTSYILPLPSESLLTLRLFGSQREVDYDNSLDPNPANVASTDQHEQSKGGEVQMNLPLGLMVGGNFIRDREDETDRLVAANTFIHAVENWGIFGQETFKTGPWSLIPSGRYDHNSQAGETSNPRVQTLFDATDWLRFSASAARSFRAPTLNELYLQVGGNNPFTGNPALQPETAWTYDGGFELHGDSNSVRVSYFRANVHNLIETTPVTFDSVVNVASARRQGAEVEAHQVLSPTFSHSLNYTYLENVGIPTGFDHFVTLALSPHHTANYTATWWPGKRWKIEPSARWEGDRYSGDDQSGRILRSQVVMDMRFAYEWRQAEFYIGSSNITNQRYEEQQGFPLPGVTFFGGFTFRLWG